MASLHIGEKIALKQPLPFPNASLSPDEHKYRGEFVLYIADCPWRLDAPDQVLTTWLASNAPDGPIVTHLRDLIGQHITDVVLTKPGLQLTLKFDSNITLHVFPDQIDPDEGDNYSLSTPEQIYIVAPGSELIIESN